MDYKKYTWVAGGIALIAIAFAALSTGMSDFRAWEHPNGQAVISVTGEGEVTALPDIATITATVSEEAKTVPEAQKAVEAKITQALSSISALGVDKKDVKTISYTVNPQYDNQNIYCISIPCPPSRSVVVGYQVSESIQVKVRKIESAGDVVGALGKANASDINGPQFTVDNMDKAQGEARDMAVKKAQEKAESIAKSLGKSLGEMIDFTEDAGGDTTPMYSLMKSSYDESVTLPEGESVIKSNVTLTYSLD